MTEITFKEIDKVIEKQIVQIWGNWVTEYGCIHYGKGCYSMAALLNNLPIGYISLYPIHFPIPLGTYSEAYIDDIEVHQDFRRNGVAKKLVFLAENWAKNYGYTQIRAWSSDDKISAIKMWHSLGYGLCPAYMRGKSVIKEFTEKPISGFYAVKRI